MGVEWSASRPGHVLPPGKGPTGQEAGWATEPVWTQRLEELSSCLCRESNLDCPVVQSVVRHYTDWTTPIPAPINRNIAFYIFLCSNIIKLIFLTYCNYFLFVLLFTLMEWDCMNCGHQQAYCSSLDDKWIWRGTVDDTVKGKLNNWERRLSQGQFVHYKSHMEWPRCEPGPPQWKVDE
jgi:hypothetical protein